MVCPQQHFHKTRSNKHRTMNGACQAWMHILRAFIDQLSFRARVVVVIFIFLIVAALILELEIPSWERLLSWSE
jgi:hypothetical protein